jgi:hypothetical protein
LWNYRFGAGRSDRDAVLRRVIHAVTADPLVPGLFRRADERQSRAQAPDQFHARRLSADRGPPAAAQGSVRRVAARIICYAFSVPVSPFVAQVNRATGETMRQQATQEGLVPLKRWLKNALDHVIHVCMNEPGLEFVWVGDDAVDPLEQAQTLQILVAAPASRRARRQGRIWALRRRRAQPRKASQRLLPLQRRHRAPAQTPAFLGPRTKRDNATRGELDHF